MDNSRLVLIGISNAVALTDDFRKHLVSVSADERTANDTTDTRVVIKQVVFNTYSQVSPAYFLLHHLASYGIVMIWYRPN
jgi:hypothetical protein